MVAGSSPVRGAEKSNSNHSMQAGTVDEGFVFYHLFNRSQFIDHHNQAIIGLIAIHRNPGQEKSGMDDVLSFW